MSRLGNVFRAIWNKMLGKTEEKYYGELLDMSYDDFVTMVNEVGADLAGVAQSKNRISKLSQDARNNATRFEAAAVKFLESGDEDNARAALDQKAQLMQQADAFDQQLAEVNANQSDLEATKKQLDLQVTKFQSSKELMKARHTAAKATAEAAETVTGISSRAANAGRVVARLQESTAQLEARGDGIKELMGKGVLENVFDPGKTPLDHSVDAIERKSMVDEDLARLKKQLEPAKTS